MAQWTGELLRSSGWQQGRNISTESYERSLFSNGYILSPTVKQFLHEFGGLQVRFVHPRLKQPSWFDFDPIVASRSLLKDDVEEYARIIGETGLVPIGQLDGNLIILMGPSGRLYGVFDDIVMQYGNDAYEALDCLCRERPSTRLR